jgi:hypothetical protein
MAEGWREFLSAWDDLRVQADEYRELDSERVLVLTRQSGRGKTSGIDLAQMQSEGATLFQVRDGKVMRLVLYTALEQALTDLGLQSESSSSHT